LDGWNHHRREKKGKAKDEQPAITKKKRREIVSPSCGRKLSHPQPL
jgi:hypothetical protein